MSCRIVSGSLPPQILTFATGEKVPVVMMLWNLKGYMAHANYQILGSRIDVAVDKIRGWFITAGDNDQVA
jgi:hypothetical protein